MTLRAIDWIKVATAETIDKGLDEIEKHPISQVYGPFRKFRPKGEVPPPARVRVEAFSNDPWMYNHGPRAASYDPGRTPREGCKVRLPNGSWLSSSRDMLEYLVWYRTPGDTRAPSYITQERAGQIAMKRWFRKISRRRARLEQRAGDAYKKFEERCNRKIAEFTEKLRVAYSTGPERKISFYEERIRYWKGRLERMDGKGLNKLLSKYMQLEQRDQLEWAPFIMKQIDLLRYSSAQRKAQWLAQPKLPAVLLPVWHIRPAQKGRGDLLIGGAGTFSVHGMPGEPGHEQRLEIQMPIDNLFGSQPELRWQIQVDEQKFRKALSSLTEGHLESEYNFGVSFVELRDIISSLEEVPKVLSGLERSFRSTCARRYGRALKAGLVTVEGLWSAFRFLSSRDLCYKFGTQDVIQFFNDYWKTISGGLSETMSRVSVLLRENQRLRSKHCVIDRDLKTETFEYPIRTIVEGQLTRYISDASIDWVSELNLLISSISPESKLVIERTTSVEQRLTVQLKSRLEDELGRAVGDDEALTRAFMSALGLDKWIQALWDLTPYTFLIDWFANVGDVLGNLRIGGLHIGYELFGAVVSETRTISHRAYILNPTSKVGSGQPVYKWNPELGATELFSGSTVKARLDDLKPLVQRVYRRNVLSRESLMRYASFWKGHELETGNLSAWQLLTGAELLATRGPDNLSNLTKARKRTTR